MKLLVLGGTIFLGRHIVDAALARGHDVTLFNRGQHNPGLYPEVEKIRGDRNTDLPAIGGRRFDAVIDTSGYTPTQVRLAAEVLSNRIDHYTFISTISVYRAFPAFQRFDESAPVSDGNEGYGPQKARAEEALGDVLPGRVACVRPGLIVGPHDPTERFTYWPRRVARGGRVLAPGRPERPVQYIDARDLAEWSVRLAETRRTGTYNAIGPESLTMGELLDGCRAAAGSNAEFVWVSDDQLLANEVSPWTELPLWIPEADPNFGGMLLADNRSAIEAGLTFRSVTTTAADTLQWALGDGRSLPPSPGRVTTMTDEREAELLRAQPGG